ncbi:small membrane protein [Klebsiella oxytoca]|uniref:Small membrane protein n=1 Tax=Klebsiella oxytoca TaxID=571 RepID=A0AAI9GTB6_KLEOX|nr:small membrane protein [Klebsiella oxytoca]EHT9905967.1 small membrane protein [Klebsiella oxytoca]EKU6741404.1 small membrane protein [Klebsiella oxytoca]EKU7135612.1 small membrane protein [Klebsiella oxytoca]EKV0272377.1 small membrane protein [Klebsiella oxytoca]EKV1580546.1 small membrane protein [Klebsiella oxytoca]
MVSFLMLLVSVILLIVAGYNFVSYCKNRKNSSLPKVRSHKR